MKYIKNPTIFIFVLLMFTSCDINELSTTGVFFLFGFLILCFIIMFVIIFRSQRSETKKMNQYVASVNNMLNNCISYDHKEKELNILINRIKNDPKYAKNNTWKNKVLAKTYLFLATIYYNKQKYDNVLDICNKIIELAPDDTSTLYNRGSLLLNKQEYIKAIADFTACLNINAKDANALNNRGLAHEKINEDKKALQDYLAALNIQESPILFLNLGNLYKKLNDKNEAIEYYEKGINTCEDENILKILQTNLSTLK